MLREDFKSPKGKTSGKARTNFGCVRGKALDNTMLSRRRLFALTGIITIACLLVIWRVQRTGGESITTETETSVSLDLSAYLDGSVRDITTDGNGNIYVTGGTTSPDFVGTPGAYQVRLNLAEPESRDVTRSDAFVAKLDSQGKLVWSTLIG